MISTRPRYISKKDHLEFCKKVKPEKGDILYTKGGTTGIAKEIDVDFEFSIWVHLALLKLKKNLVDPTFLEVALNSKFGRSQAARYTGGIANRDLVLNRMKKIIVPIPSIAEQKKFAKMVKDIRRLLNNQKNSHLELSELKNLLFHKAFIGELVN